MNNTHPAIEEAKQNADSAKNGTADLATRIVNAIVSSQDKTEDHIVKLRETLIEVYQNGRWDGQRDVTNLLKTGTPSEKMTDKQVEIVPTTQDEVKRVETTRFPVEMLPKLGLPCTLCGTYGESGKPCTVCEIRKKRGMIPS